MASYYVWSGATGSANGTSWANAYTTLSTAFSGKAAGDIFYVAHDHAEISGVNTVITSAGTVGNPVKVICANRAGSVPPVSADRRTTAQVSTSGDFSLSPTGYTHWDGVIFTAGNSTANPNLNIGNTVHWQRFDNCSLRIGSTGATAQITMSSQSATVELNNTTVSFGNAGQSFGVTGCLKWRNTPTALLGTIPTILFKPSSSSGIIDCIGVDLSAAGSGKTIYGAASTTAAKCTLIDCKLNAAVTKSAVPTGDNDIDFIRTAATGNYAVYRNRISGLLTEETTIVRSGGASDGTTPISWKVATTANCHFTAPFNCPPIAIWNDTTGSPKTATIEGIWGGGAVPNDDEIWVDLEYLGDASSPQGSFVNDGKADLLATAAGQTSSSATWGGSTTKFKLNVTFTAQQKGWLYARVKCAKASSTFYVDPLVTLT